MTQVEICVESGQGARAAMAGRADRVELCASLDVGGLTPSAGLMRFAAEAGIPARALIRPRAGSFLYDADAVAVIERDIDMAADLELGGVVIGAVGADGRLDRDLLSRLVDRCGPLGKTLHRVFDLTPDPFESLEMAIDLGFDRILTSGHARTAIEGAPLLSRLVEASRGRITIIAAAGITPDTVGALLRATSVPEVHASCRILANANPDTRLEALGFGAPPRITDVHAVARLAAVAKTLDALGRQDPA